MRSALIGLVALALAPAAFAQSSSEGTSDRPQRGSAPTPADRNSTSESSQRGSMGSTAGGEERTSTPGAGIESGEANGMAGGRTDEGPRGGTGIRSTPGHEHGRARAKADDQARGPNKPGEFLRPAETPPQMNRRPVAKGSRAPNIPPEQEPQAQSKKVYGRANHRGRAGGIASGTGNPSAASPEGSAGKGAQTKPER